LVIKNEVRKIMPKNIKLPSGKMTDRKARWKNLPKNPYVKRVKIKPIVKKGKFAGWKTIATEKKRRSYST
tara:strand:- start:50 stop:259 length:210 start_codon:yes stop_codon:yes gene_type:complete